MEEDDKKIRHTISAEETFTLAKDVFDLRTLIKNVYSNRAVISRRINIITFCVSTLFTLVYLAYVIFASIYGKIISQATEITLYVLAGAYALLGVVLLTLTLISFKTSAKNIKKLNTALKIIRLTVRLVSIVLSIAAIALSGAEGGSVNVALEITVIILSVITILVQLLPMFFGGAAKFVRWLISPVKIKMRFSAVSVEWYNLAVTGKPPAGTAHKISKRHYDAIGQVIDGVLNPALGKKYINAIKPAQLLDIAENCDAESRPVAEGVLKSIFAYAAECGYVVFDPCRDLNFTGSVEEEKKKTFKERLAGVGVKLGKKMLDKYIAASSDTDSDENGE